MSKLKDYANGLRIEVSKKVEEDLINGEVSNNTKELGYLSGLLNLHTHIGEELENYFETRFSSNAKEYLEIIKLMVHDELRYLEKILELIK